MKTTKILITGAGGQLGYELAPALQSIYGWENVILSDVRASQAVSDGGIFEIVDVTQKNRLFEVIQSHGVTQIYHLAALLSAKGEKNPQKAWQLNMEGLLSILELAAERKLDKVYWPSSIAVFGPATPKENAPQQVVTDPSSVYGITKLAGERWCEYYFRKYGLDVRSLRYPGLISYQVAPGGGVTDYANELYVNAKKQTPYSCFLAADTRLPMMYMDDAVRATLELMEAPVEWIKTRASYNIAAMTLSPEQIATAVKSQIPEFTITYNPDFRQAIAASWPHSIDDSRAREDWGWQPRFDLERMTERILENVKIC